MSLLRFSDVWLERGPKLVLERVNLSIEAGAFVSVVGPSGAGKSSFLKLVLGELAPSRGQIAMEGKPLRAEPGPDRGVVFQRYSVFPHMNALANVQFGLECERAPRLGRAFGAKGRAIRAEAMALLEAVGLGASAALYPSALSGGMQQRLAIAQALAMRPRILLLDEPFGALDPGARTDMHALVTGLWRERGLTILMVTHDIEEAFKLGTRVITIDRWRQDPQAPDRFGATIVYDLPLDRKQNAAQRARYAAGAPPALA